MIGKEVLSKKPVSIYEIEDYLSDIEEPTYEQKATLDYVKEVKKVDKEKALEAINKLKELGLDEELAVKIVNVYPTTVSQLHAVLMKEKVEGEDIYDKILQILKGE